MLCTVSKYQSKVEDMDEVSKIIKEQFIPGMIKYEGCRGAEFLTKPDTGEFVVMKFWDNEEYASMWHRSEEHKHVVVQLIPLLIGRNGTHDYYEVQSRIVEENRPS